MDEACGLKKKGQVLLVEGALPTGALALCLLGNSARLPPVTFMMKDSNSSSKIHPVKGIPSVCFLNTGFTNQYLKHRSLEWDVFLPKFADIWCKESANPFTQYLLEQVSGSLCVKELGVWRNRFWFSGNAFCPEHQSLAYRHICNSRLHRLANQVEGEFEEDLKSLVLSIFECWKILHHKRGGFVKGVLAVWPLNREVPLSELLKCIHAAHLMPLY